MTTHPVHFRGAVHSRLRVLTVPSLRTETRTRSEADGAIEAA